MLFTEFLARAEGGFLPRSRRRNHRGADAFSVSRRIAATCGDCSPDQDLRIRHDIDRSVTLFVP
jgi:hypothetical protein